MKNTVIKMDDFLCKRQERDCERIILISDSRHIAYCVLYDCDLEKEKVYIFELDFKEKQIRKSSQNLTDQDLQCLSYRHKKISKERAALLLKEILDLQNLLHLPIQHQYDEIYEYASHLDERISYEERILKKEIFQDPKECVLYLQRAMIQKDFGLIFELFGGKYKQKYKNRWEFFITHCKAMGNYAINYFLIQQIAFDKKEEKYLILLSVPVYYEEKMFDSYLYIELVQEKQIFQIDQILFLDVVSAKKRNQTIKRTVSFCQYQIKEQEEMILALFDFYLIGENNHFKIYKRKWKNGQVYALLKNQMLQLVSEKKKLIEEVEEQFMTLKEGIICKEIAEDEKELVKIIYEIMNDEKS